MFNNIHNQKRKLLLRLQVKDGAGLKNMVLLLSSYMLCALVNNLFHLVLELVAHKNAPATYYAHQLHGAIIISKAILVLIIMLILALEIFLIRSDTWLSRIFLALIMLLVTYMLTERLPAPHNSSDEWLYFQTGLSWAGAVGVYLLAPVTILRHPCGKLVRYSFYAAVAILSCILLTGYI